MKTIDLITSVKFKDGGFEVETEILEVTEDGLLRVLPKDYKPSAPTPKGEQFGAEGKN